MTFTLLIAFAYVAVAGLLDVNLVFAAFLAGFAVSRKRLGDALATISGFSFALFIPVYFALVGYSLIFGKAFSIPMLLAFLAGACVLKLLAVAWERGSPASADSTSRTLPSRRMLAAVLALCWPA